MLAYEPQFTPTDVVLVGLGGTGGRLAPLLAQFIGQMTLEEAPKLHFFDGDTVEKKNLSRQNFIGNDVGKNKAQVMADRYGKAYQVNIICHPVFCSFDYMPIFSQAVKGNRIVVILAVDTVQGRRDCINSLTNIRPPANKWVSSPSLTHDFFFIDVGNSNTHGQVKIFNNFNMMGSSTMDSLLEKLEKYDKETPFTVRNIVPYIPLQYKYYGEMKAEEETLSCADIDQTMAVNFMAASHVFGLFQSFMNKELIDCMEIHFSLTGGGHRKVGMSERNYFEYGYNSPDDICMDTSVVYPTDVKVVDPAYGQSETVKMQLRTVVNTAYADEILDTLRNQQKDFCRYMEDGDLEGMQRITMRPSALYTTN